MTESDYELFMSEFRRMAAAFERYPQSADAMRSRGDVYFNVLKRWPLSAVISKTDAWIEQQTKMPKPAEWSNQIIQHRQTEIYADMNQDEAKEWLRAEKQKWEDEPCHCRECIEARVTEMPRRFAPVFDSNDSEVHGLCFGRIVARGEWLHGFALMRWYLAKENFTSLRKKKLRIRMAQEQAAATEAAISRMLGERD